MSMNGTALSRRKFLRAASLSIGGAVLAACAPTPTPAPPADKAPAAPTAAPAAKAVVTIKVGSHWGGKTGEAFQKMIDDYNKNQGAQDKIKAEYVVNGNATQTVSQGFGLGPTPAPQRLVAPAPPPQAAKPAPGAPAAAPAPRPPQPYEGSYPHSLVQDVIPFVEKHYRVIANRDNRAIAGLSMGGGHTTMATNNNPGVFGYIGVFSAGARTTDEALVKQLTTLKESGVKLYWVGVGAQDMALEGSRNLAALVKKIGFNTVYREIPGTHYWFIWRVFLGEFGSLLFK